jgi:hypothetical protein
MAIYQMNESMMFSDILSVMCGEQLLHNAVNAARIYTTKVPMLSHFRTPYTFVFLDCLFLLKPNRFTHTDSPLTAVLGTAEQCLTWQCVDRLPATTIQPSADSSLQFCTSI